VQLRLVVPVLWLWLAAGGCTFSADLGRLDVQAPDDAGEEDTEHGEDADRPDDAPDVHAEDAADDTAPEADVDEDAGVDAEDAGPDAEDAPEDADEDGGAEADDGGAPDCAGAPYDPGTGLCWHFSTARDWPNASGYCGTLTAGGVSAGTWRQPSINELRGLVRGCTATEPGGGCAVTDTCVRATCDSAACAGCTEGAGPWSGCYSPDWYPAGCPPCWSSSYDPVDSSFAWGVLFGNAEVYRFDKGNPVPIAACVRLGT
jgi:hypothetical protein